MSCLRLKGVGLRIYMLSAVARTAVQEFVRIFGIFICTPFDHDIISISSNQVYAYMGR